MDDKEKFAEKMGVGIGDPDDLPPEVRAEMRKQAQFQKHVKREVDPFGVADRTYYWTWYPTPDEPNTDGYEINLVIPQARIYERFVSHMVIVKSKHEFLEQVYGRELTEDDIVQIVNYHALHALWLIVFQDDLDKQEDIDKLIEPNYKYEISLDRLYPELLKKLEYPDYISYAKKAIVDLYDHLQKGADAENPPTVRGSH